MAEVLFYHLTETTLYDALPGLVERSVARGWNVVIQAASDERREALDAHLWTFRDDSFLAHGSRFFSPRGRAIRTPRQCGS